MPRIDIGDLRWALLIGAIVGAAIGFGSGTLRASGAGAEAAAASSACRMLCENAVWLRAPVLRRTGGH